MDLVSEADLAGKQGDMASVYANSSLKAKNDAQLDAYISQRDEVSPEVSRASCMQLPIGRAGAG